jgi:hypothetical protein
VSQLSRQCGILNISQPYRPPWPVTGIAIFLLYKICINNLHMHDANIDTHTPVFRTLQEMHTNRPYCLNKNITNYTDIQIGHMQYKRKTNKLWVRTRSVLTLTASHAERSVTRWMFVWAPKRVVDCWNGLQWRRLGRSKENITPLWRMLLRCWSMRGSRHGNRSA